MNTYTTPNGKEIQIVPDGRGMYKIQFTTGGELHQVISGLYTSEREAEKAVLYFLSMKEDQEAKVLKAKDAKNSK